MKKLAIFVVVVLLCASSFVAGWFIHLRSAAPQTNPTQLSAVRPVKPSLRDGEHLVPVPLWRADTMEIARAVFKEAYGADVRARVYQWLPGDNVLFIKEHEGRYSVVGLTSHTQLIQYQKDYPFAKRHPPEPSDYHDIKPERCEAKLPPEVARRIVELWRAALLQTRYDSEGGPACCIDFQAVFSMEEQRTAPQQLEGMTWFPEGHVAALLDVYGNLRSVCEAHSTSNSVDHLDDLQRDLDELQRELR